jgi:geranylgeranyl diphosphate synthase type II
MLAAEAVGGDAAHALDAACAIEMVHAFSLIHDDLPAIDNDDLRRGQPTCHVKFGEAVAILAGDALFALAFEVLASAPLNASALLQSVRRLTIAVGSDGLVGGETVDVLSEGKEPTRDAVEFIHSRKTGALIAASCAIGALHGGGSAAQVEALDRFGASIGLAFQIADDVLNETSTAEQLGKASGSDRARSKATYPAVFGLDAAIAAGQVAADRSLHELDSLGPNADPLRQLAQFFVERRS